VSPGPRAPPGLRRHLVVVSKRYATPPRRAPRRFRRRHRRGGRSRRAARAADTAVDARLRRHGRLGRTLAAHRHALGVRSRGAARDNHPGGTPRRPRHPGRGGILRRVDHPVGVPDLHAAVRRPLRRPGGGGGGVAARVAVRRCGVRRHLRGCRADRTVGCGADSLAARDAASGSGLPRGCPVRCYPRRLGRGRRRHPRPPA
jgi:hypothetical protein